MTDQVLYILHAICGDVDDSQDKDVAMAGAVDVFCLVEYNRGADSIHHS